MGQCSNGKMVGCPRAWDRLFVLERGYATCCNAEVAKAARVEDPGYTLTPDEAWNHGTFQELRRKTSAGDWEWCQKCPLVHQKKVPVEFFPPESPRRIHLVDSPSCNLRCPSCRPRQWTENSSTQTEKRDRLMAILDRFLPGASHLKMLGSGEVFASPMHMDVLRGLSIQQYPHLKLSLITNGTMLHRRWEDFHNIHQLVHRIEISLDAATEETYRQVRLGGDWHDVISSVQLCRRLMENGKLGAFHLRFCANRINCHEITQFVNLAERAHAQAHVSLMQKWHESPWYEEHTLLKPEFYNKIRDIARLPAMKASHVNAPQFHHFDKVFNTGE